MIANLRSLYKGCLLLLASLAAGIILSILVLILVDVTMRTVGIQPPRVTSGLVEYGLLYATMFAAPWLLHRSGHVTVTSFISLMPGRVRRVIERISLITCILAGLIFTYYSFSLFVSEIAYGASDIRSIRIPRYLLYAPLPIGFGLMTIEFVIRLIGGIGIATEGIDANSEGL